MMSNQSLVVVNLTFAQRILTEYVYSAWLIFGIPGCLLNLWIFSRPHLRITSCSIYFFAASADHLLTLIVGITPIMHDLNYPDPQTSSVLFCKIRGYIFQISLMLSRWFIAFACVDRYASSSDQVRLRNFAQPRIAYRMIFVVILTWAIICSHRLIFYDVSGNLCSILNNTPAAIYHAAYVIIGGGVFPTAIMIVGAFLVHRNLLHKQLTRVRQTRRAKKQSFSDHQVLRLLLIQIICYVIFTMPQLANLTFNAISNTIPNRSEERLTIERFITYMGELMLYLFPVTTFYLYTLTSRTFRKELLKILRSVPLVNRLAVVNKILPMTNNSTMPAHIELTNARLHGKNTTVVQVGDNRSKSHK